MNFILTIEQVQELHMLIIAMKETLLSSVEGTAKVAKAIQTYLGCQYSEAVEVLYMFVTQMETL